MPALDKRTDGILCEQYEKGVTSLEKVFCPGKTCVANWSYNGTTTIIYKGCSIYDEGDPLAEYCGEKLCYSYTSVNHILDESPTSDHICCCKSELCNRVVYKNSSDVSTKLEVTRPFIHTTMEDGLAHLSNSELTNVGVAAFISVMLIAIYLGLHYFPKGFRSAAVKCIKLESPVGSSTAEISNTYAIPSELLQKEISEKFLVQKGKYATIFKGKLNDHRDTICIKEFDVSTIHGRTLYANETKCHAVLRKINHQNVIKYFGNITFPANNQNPKIAMEYCKQGSLRRYLRTKILNIDICLTILSDIAKAVSFLHTPGVSHSFFGMVHRDISSTNFFVRADVSVVIADFGLSLLFSDSVGGGNDKTSIAAAGTLNYMAPEILRGTINLKNHISALKQADVYSMALVMWEVLNRCSDLHGNAQNVPEATVPYEIETLGGKQLYDIVVTDEIRPSFPSIRKTLYKTFVHSSVTSLSSKDSGHSTNDSFCATEAFCDTIDHWSLGGKSDQISKSSETLGNNESNDSDYLIFAKDRSNGVPIRSKTQCILALLKRTITESWDPQGDARLTASTVLDRFVSCTPSWDSKQNLSCKIVL